MNHGELREESNAISREDVFRVLEQALLLLSGTYVSKVMIGMFGSRDCQSLQSYHVI